MVKITLDCSNCGVEFQKSPSEYNRRKRLGKQLFFCSKFCSDQFQKADLKPKYTICKNCGKEFNSCTRHKSGGLYYRVTCSSYCASAIGGKSIERSEMGKKLQRKYPYTIHHTASGLRTREWGKYKDLHDWLNKKEIKHIFEYVALEKYICDLYLPEYDLIIEFDESYHSRSKQRQKDEKRDSELLQTGLTVIRAVSSESFLKDIKKIINALES